ncbi:MAG: hypothetical protein LBH01_01030 [Verrucomicrobiales bacterium]|jgi:hypothetical protein|nr:hypothetical protein [Verrucomicrobiales bacterium]
MNRDDYSLRQDTANAAYRVLYRDWVKGLNTVQRAELTRLGVLAPDSSSQVYKVDCDPEEVWKAQVTVDLTELDGLPEKLAERFGIPLETAQKLARWHGLVLSSEAQRYRAFLFQRLIAGFLQAKNPKLAAAGLAFAAELNALNGLGSQAEYARKIGLSRQALSKTTKFWQTELELETSVFQKSEKACGEYARNSLTNHWRKRKYGKGKNYEGFAGA